MQFISSMGCVGSKGISQDPNPRADPYGEYEKWEGDTEYEQYEDHYSSQEELGEYRVHWDDDDQSETRLRPMSAKFRKKSAKSATTVTSIMSDVTDQTKSVRKGESEYEDQYSSQEELAPYRVHWDDDDDFDQADDPYCPTSASIRHKRAKSAATSMTDFDPVGEKYPPSPVRQRPFDKRAVSASTSMTGFMDPEYAVDSNIYVVEDLWACKNRSRMHQVSVSTKLNKQKVLHMEAGLRAPSLSLWYDDNVPGDILTQDIYVPRSGLTKQTYYCALQWNSGKNGGGYCGIQDHGMGRNYIFSLWDPVGSTGVIRPVYMGPGTTCEPFGGEGTGLKSWNFELSWEPDSWYTFITRRWDLGGQTFFGLWVKHQVKCRWFHMVTMAFPIPNIYFETWTCCFLEDWQGTGQNERRVHFKNGYKREQKKTWIPFTKATFTVVSEESSRQYADRYDCGTFEETFFLQSGADTIPSSHLEEGSELNQEMDSEPDALPLSCYLTSVTKQQLVWEIPPGNVPQYRYVLKVDGKHYKEEIDSEKRTCAFMRPPKELIELTIEDIYGRVLTLCFSVQEGMAVYK